MRRSLGITEPIWADLPEEQRTSWKFFSRFVALVGTWFIAKTGYAYVDWVIWALTLAFLAIVIETQRSYSKLKPQYRKRCTRIAVFLGFWGVVIYGAVLFAEVSIASAAPIFSTEVMSTLNQGTITFVTAIMVVMFLVAFRFAVLRVITQLHLEETIFLLRDGLRQLLVHKQPKANSFPMFACMELTALLVCLMYASFVADLVKMTINVVRL